jgi:hypothetical protein
MNTVGIECIFKKVVSTFVVQMYVNPVLKKSFPGSSDSRGFGCIHHRFTGTASIPTVNTDSDFGLIKKCSIKNFPMSYLV